MNRVRSFLSQHWFATLLLISFVGFQVYDRAPTKSRARPKVTTATPSVEDVAKLEERRQGLIESEIRDQKLTGTPLALAPSQGNARRVLPREWFYHGPSLPTELSGDVLAKLGIKLENETPPEFGLTDEVIRAVADQSYALIGQVADEGLTGYSLHVRLNHTGEASTGFDKDRRRVVISIDPTLAVYSLGHELAHVLLGRVTADSILPGFVNEFVAEAAEKNGTPTLGNGPRFDYERLNRPIFGLSRTLDGTTGVIGTNSPLDGFRYDLLRLGGEKIGADKHRELAHEIVVLALNADRPLSMADVKPLFETYGLGDCVLFTETTEVGAYVDVAFTTDGVPFVFNKQVDGQGVESSFPATLRFTWRKDGKPLWSFSGGTNEAGMFVDAGGATYAPFADQYDVTIGTETIVYMIDGEHDPLAVEQTKTRVVPLAHSL